jgi:hypothetical protein
MAYPGQRSAARAARSSRQSSQGDSQRFMRSVASSACVDHLLRADRSAPVDRTIYRNNRARLLSEGALHERPYNEIWAGLQDVRIIGHRLWASASADILQEFIDALQTATVAINKGRLLLRESAYADLRHLLTHFEDYQVGKQRLIEIRTREPLDQNFAIFCGTDIEEQIRSNDARRREYERALEAVASHFREQLGSHSIPRNCPNASVASHAPD